MVGGISAHLGCNTQPMTITFEHALEEDAGNVTITHAVTIDGGEESQMDNIGKGITAGLAGCLKKLLSM